MKRENNHTHLVCIDSDGCAIDGMNIKHLECFGPCVIDVWGLEKYREELLTYWNEINLYSMTRGVNRFKGLLKILKYANKKEMLHEDLTIFEKWVAETKELSNASLNELRTVVSDEVLEKAIDWSEKVNKSIAEIPEKKKIAFTGVEQILERVHKMADVAVVSAANAEAIAAEWEYNRLLDKVDKCMGQECGSKKECIQKLLNLGYEREKVIMLGDAAGDYQAARENGILFYPIQVSKEVSSWKEFGEVVFPMFLEGAYTESEMNKYVKQFYENLGGVE